MSTGQVFRLIVLMTAFAISVPAYSESKTTVKKTTVTSVETESDGAAAPEQSEPSGGNNIERESSITAQFGSKGGTGTTGCKTEDLSKSVIKDLKADCNAWVKDQKAELKTRFLTSSCQESCEDCTMNLKRCSVTGTVRYQLK